MSDPHSTLRPAAPDRRVAALANLRGWCASLGELQTDLAGKQAVMTRLNQAVAARDRAAAALAELRAADDAVLARWLVDGAEGPRPEPSPAALAAEQALAPLARDVAAAETALPEANAAVGEAARRVAEEGRRRDEAAWRAAVETVRHQAREAVAALNGFLRWQTKFESVADALAGRRRDQEEDRAAAACSLEIREIIRQVKAEAGVAHDHAAGPLLLQGLLAGEAGRL